jgi:HAD superfamily hydrolase (TIGR01490 family)
MKNTRPVVAAFDFDGTITRRDTFVEFIRFAHGAPRCFAGFLVFLPLLAAMKLKLLPNHKVKRRVFSFFFKGMKLEVFNGLCDAFARGGTACNARVLGKIAAHTRAGDRKVVVSASIENWVRPFAEKLGMDGVLCTRVEVGRDGRLTGRFDGPNCHGREKVVRLLEAFPNRSDYHLVAYGDSAGDRELIAFADEGVWVRRLE